MIIVHIAPNAPYNDKWGYQENLLPKYQKRLGNEVTLIVSNETMINSSLGYVKPQEYILDDGVRIIRVAKKHIVNSIITNIITYTPVYHYLKRINPDFIFFHGLISSSIFDVIKYKRKINRDCVIVQDNHLDYQIGMSAKGFKKKILMCYYRLINKLSIKWVSKVYGVTPWRKQYAEEYFGIPKSKTDVLIMGADDDELEIANRNVYRNSIREKYNISESDFLVVTGGKIDDRKNIDILVKACVQSNNMYKVLFFGSIDDSVKKDIEPFIDNNWVIYIGWISASEVYQYFFAADLVLFPGQHSVLWEQACASKTPCVFKYWEGMQHVNNGGNSLFIHDISVEEINRVILGLIGSEEYKMMKCIAESPNTDIYLYSKIAKKSLECAEKEHN